MNRLTMESPVQRLNRLGREDRRLNRMGAVFLAVIAAVVLMGQAAPTNMVKGAEGIRSILQDTRFLMQTGIAAVIAFTATFLGVYLSFSKERRAKEAEEKDQFARIAQSVLIESASNYGILKNIKAMARSGSAFASEIRIEALQAALNNSLFHRRAEHSLITAATILRTQLATLNNFLFVYRQAVAGGRGPTDCAVRGLQIRTDTNEELMRVLQELLDETMHQFGATFVGDSRSKEIGERLIGIITKERELLERV